ncbi:MAG: S8 family serine peptidase [Gemmatimonadota bacterium]|nr:S8 family serine peptidase [Gemmatimonadota bacterium]
MLAILAGCAREAPTVPDVEEEPPVDEQPRVVPRSADPSAETIVSGRLLVRLDPQAAAGAAALSSTPSLTLEREVAPGLWIARVEVGQEESIAEALAASSDIMYAEPDYVRTVTDSLCASCRRPTDNLFAWQWNMHNEGEVDIGYGLVESTGAIDADIDWLEAYDLLGPRPPGDVRIGILDTGVRASHQDICGKVVLEKNFYDGSANADDDYGHGSHVAAIAGACADNEGRGIVGVAYGPNMTFVVGKVCAADGTCEVSAIVEAIRWAADNGANVINMSFGDTAQSQAEAEALQYAADQGVLMFCAAGNAGTPFVFFPAADPNCIAVTATDWGDDRSSYSSYGTEAELAAPGGDIENWLGLSYIASAWAGWDEDYVLTIGTSMAAPHAAGLGALLYALGLTDPRLIRSCLRLTADDLGPPGWDPEFGWGRINMFNAVSNLSSCAAGGGNAPPSARFAVVCSELGCTFDASASTDFDGSIVDYRWDFGDGGVGSGIVTTHTFAGPGTYAVTLSVTDDEGATGSLTRVASVGGMHVGDLEGSVTSSGSGWAAVLTVLVVTSDGTPVRDARVSVSWNGAVSGDATGSTDADGLASFQTGEVVTGSGVTFVVDDVVHASFVYHPSANADADGDSDGTTLTVSAPTSGPTAEFTWSCGQYDASLNGYVCDFTDLSSSIGGSIVDWSWDFGVYGSTPSTEQNPTNVYPYAGGFVLDYLVSLTVTDDRGGTSWAFHLVTVPPDAP